MCVSCEPQSDDRDIKSGSDGEKTKVSDGAEFFRTHWWHHGCSGSGRTLFLACHINDVCIDALRRTVPKEISFTKVHIDLNT